MSVEHARPGHLRGTRVKYYWNKPVITTFGYTQQERYTSCNTGEILMEYAHYGYPLLHTKGEIYCMEHR